MAETTYLVDHENLSTIDLENVPANARVVLFLGANEKSVRKQLLTGVVRLGERLKLVEVDGTGKNALDFHLAFYLGQTLTATPGAQCVVLSKDKGFSPLVRHLIACGFHVRQAETLRALDAAEPTSSPTTMHVPAPAPAPAPAPVSASAPAAASKVDPHYAHVVKALNKVPVRSLPHTRAKLQKHVTSMLNGKKGVAEAVPKIIKRLFNEGLVKEDGKELSYPTLTK